jgi:hypothetical protein
MTRENVGFKAEPSGRDYYVNSSALNLANEWNQKRRSGKRENVNELTPKISKGPRRDQRNQADAEG